MGSSVCVSIVHYNAPDLLERCLETFQRYPPRLPYRIVVADNSASFLSIQKITSRFPHCTLVEIPRNIGFSAANNRAVQGATEQYLFFLNPDTELQEGTIETLVARIDGDAEVGAVGPMNVGADGEVQFSCRTFPGYSTILAHRYSLLTRLFPNNRISSGYLQATRDHNQSSEVDWISGAALLLRRSDFETLGGFDEAFFLYAEDVDLCYRLHQRGCKIVYEPASKVQHSIGGSSRRHRFRALWERHRSMYTFYKKHYSLEIPLVDFMTLLGITLRGVSFLFLEAIGRAPHR
jgi:GT2 family glycosyltransferase